MSLYKSYNPLVDWITATAREGSDGQHALYMLSRNLANDLGKMEGILTEDWMFYGYTGFVLRGNGHVAYGERKGQGSILQAGGALSARIWADVANSADNVTRFDIAVDVALSEADPGIANLCYDYVKRDNREGRRRRYALYQGHTGSTLYIGSRKSNQFGRLYDKSAERGEAPGEVWRYELELKGENARQVAYVLLEHYNDPRDAKRTLGDMITRTVYRWFSDRLVEPLFEANGQGIQMMTARAHTALDQKLAWIRNQVKPSVHKLIASGYEKEVIDALGLSRLDDVF